MEEKKNEAPKGTKKLSYEQLNQVVGDLYQQNQQLVNRVKQLQAAMNDAEFNKLSFFISMLFKVIEHSDVYKPDFVVWCVDSIESALNGFADTFCAQKESESTDDDCKKSAEN